MNKEKAFKVNEYKKLTEIRLINYIGGEKVKKKHLTPSGRWLVERIEKKGEDYKIVPWNKLHGFKAYLSSADLLTKKEQIYV
jgi:hypothetical protein